MTCKLEPEDLQGLEPEDFQDIELDVLDLELDVLEPEDFQLARDGDAGTQPAAPAPPDPQPCAEESTAGVAPYTMPQ